MENSTALQVGEKAEAALVVTDEDTAKALAISPEDDLPKVFATSRMIALMETAASRVMKRVLEPHQLSVGVGVYVQHTAATPSQTEVRAVATFLGKEDKLYQFKVEAFDSGGKIGEGKHTRAIVDAERLLSGAKKRVGVALKSER